METNTRCSVETGSPAICPFRHEGQRLCLASSSGLVPDPRRRLKYCLTDNFDNCPFFLFRCLRSSQNYSRHIEGARGKILSEHSI